MAIKNIRKTRKNITRKTKRSRSKVNARKLSKVMKGGDAGRYVLPSSYFSNNTDGYYPEGSPELLSGGKQHAVSQGSVWENGEYAGPNLYPTIKMNGGGCGCNSRRNSKKSKSKRSKSKSKRSKSIKRMKGGTNNNNICTNARIKWINTNWRGDNYPTFGTPEALAIGMTREIFDKCKAIW